MKATKNDVNKNEIFEAFKKFGFSVQYLNGTAYGVPDLLVGKYGINLLVVIERDAEDDAKKAVNHFIAKWRGEVHIVRDVDDVVVIFNEMTARKKEGDL